MIRRYGPQQVAEKEHPLRPNHLVLGVGGASRVVRGASRVVGGASRVVGGPSRVVGAASRAVGAGVCKKEVRAQRCEQVGTVRR